MASWAVEEMAREGIQDDRRFAESYGLSRAERGYGPLRILAELRQRGVDPELAQSTLSQDAELWHAQIRRAYRKRWGEGAPADRLTRLRVMEFLRYRGFSAEQIQALFEEMNGSFSTTNASDEE